MRAPYKYFLPRIKEVQERVLSIDIPSGWDANEGNINSLFVPKYLISLGIPKQCSEKFEGEHYLGGRFIPPSVAEELGIELPVYQGIDLFTKL